MKRTFLVGLAIMLAALWAGDAFAGEKLMVYTSMKESLIGKLRDAYAKKHPEVAFDYYSSRRRTFPTRRRSTPPASRLPRS